METQTHKEGGLLMVEITITDTYKIAAYMRHNLENTALLTSKNIYVTFPIGLSNFIPPLKMEHSNI